jgi:AraC-like DNA-binding protein
MLRLSTRAVPEHHRLAFVHDFVARHVVGMEFHPVERDRLDVDLAALALPDQAILADARYPALRGARSRALLGDGRDDYQLMIHTRDHFVSVAGKPPVRVAAGDLMVVNQAVALECRIPDTLLKLVALNRARLARLVPRIDERSCYIIPATAPGMTLFAGYAELLRASPPEAPGCAGLASRHLYELVAHLLGDIVSGDNARGGEGIGAARLALVKQEIRARLADPALDIGQVARRQGVTPRYIQRLFAAEGGSFTTYLRDCRLEEAMRRLREGRAGSIAEIAYEAGFQDLSHFNRAFRGRYGCTPSEIRAQALRDRAG